MPRVLVTDKLASYEAAHRVVMPSVAHRRSKYLNNRAENSHQPTRQMRAGDETLQISQACPTVRVGVQRHFATFPGPSAPVVGGRLPTGDDQSLPGLG